MRGRTILGDSMHFNREGRDLLAELLRPVVEPLWQTQSTQSVMYLCATVCLNDYCSKSFQSSFSPATKETSTVRGDSCYFWDSATTILPPSRATVAQPSCVRAAKSRTRWGERTLFSCNRPWLDFRHGTAKLRPASRASSCTRRKGPSTASKPAVTIQTLSESCASSRIQSAATGPPGGPPSWWCRSLGYDGCRQPYVP